MRPPPRSSGRVRGSFGRPPRPPDPAARKRFHSALSIVVICRLDSSKKGPLLSVHREASVSLFSYGTLQQPKVQLATFGRLLEGRPDALPGFAVAPLAITDPEVVAISGAAIHSIARRTGDSADLIPGIVFNITPAELEAADAYEVSAARIEVGLASGAKAFAYVSVEA
jgi:hypothetical protein